MADISTQADTDTRAVRLEAWHVIPGWIVATCLGGMLCWSGVYWFTLRSFITSHGDIETAKKIMLTGMNPIGIMVMLALGLFMFFGPALAASQWLALRRTLPPIWILAGTLGWIAALVTLAVCTFLTWDYGCLSTIGAFLAGSALGCVQWLVLPRRATRKIGPGAWAAYNGAGLCAGMLTLWLVASVLVSMGREASFFDEYYFPNSLIAVAAGLLVYGSITGFGLARILARQSRPTGVDTQEDTLAADVQRT